ncbi:hypothetical protein FHT09_003254 [Xanthomonas arboricola]|nr:hypothetical protein [Xanthomonas sp. CFBP 8152]
MRVARSLCVGVRHGDMWPVQLGVLPFSASAQAQA